MLEMTFFIYFFQYFFIGVIKLHVLGEKILGTFGDALTFRKTKRFNNLVWMEYNSRCYICR